MEQPKVEVVANKRRTILDKTTLLEKDFKIPNLEHFMWTQTKHNYDKHIEWMENQKDIVMEEYWTFKARVMTFFLIGWEASMPNVMLEFLNTFLIKKRQIFTFGIRIRCM